MGRESLIELVNEVPEHMIEGSTFGYFKHYYYYERAEDDAFCIFLAEAAGSEDDGTRYTMDEVI